MSIANAVQQLIYVEENIRKENIYDRSTMCVGLARVGRDDQLVISGTLGELATIDFGGPLHSLVIVGEMHELEREMLMEFHCSKIKDVKKISWATKFIKKEVKSNTKNNQKNTNDAQLHPAYSACPDQCEGDRKLIKIPALTAPT